MIAWSRGGLVAAVVWLLSGCNSDVPVSAVAHLAPAGGDVTVTRVATHPFLARFNLRLTVESSPGCLATSDLFPDTGGVSRRNVYRGAGNRLYVIGQFDVRRFDARSCRIELIEFGSVETGLLYLGTFDTDATGGWKFFSPDVRPERPFPPP